MVKRYLGGVLSPTTPTVTALTASGMYTVTNAAQYRAAGTWPQPSDIYFEYVSMLLPGNGTNGAQNNTFLDSSTNNFTITRNGNTTQGTFSPYGANWSNYFDGNGDYLSAASNAAFAPGTGDFTIECFVNLGSLTGSQGFFQNTSSTSSALSDKFWFGYGGGTGVILSAHNGGSGQASASWSPSIGVWYHVAVVRQSGTIKMFVDGVSLSVTGSTTFNGYSLGQAGVSVGLVTTPSYFTGYISNLRYVVGTAVYTSTFTPPTAPLTAIANTSLLTCADNRFIDDSNNNFTITPNGDAKVQRFSPFNPTAVYSADTIGGSGYFDGTGDYLDAGTNAALGFGTGDFTVEAWIYRNASGSFQIYTNGPTSSGSWAFYVYLDKLQTDYYGGTSLAGATTLTTNAWNHVAVVRSGSTLSIYLNGNRDATTTTSSNNTTSNGVVGRDWTNGSGYANGYMASVRVVKGSAVYSGTTYTVPTAPLTAIANTSLLLNFTNSGIIDNAMMNDLETVGNAQISTSVSKFGGGSILLNAASTYMTMRSSPNFAFGTGDFTLEMWAYFTSVANFPTLTDSRANSSSTAGFNLGLSSAKVQLYTTSQLAIGATTLSANTWYHIAVCRAGSTLRIFLNGVQDASVTNSTNWSDQTLIIGATPDLVNLMTGNIDDLRITRGYARYTANFTAPTAPFQLQ